MSQDAKFFGWVGKDKDSIGKLVWEEFTPKPFTDDDVDIQITHCGICASDLHTLRSGWGPTDYPAVVGHEIVGKAVKVGKNVKHVAVGDRVGVGAQADSCRKCEYCDRRTESYCLKMVGTYGSRHHDGSKSFGGYADYTRTPSRFVFKIPAGIPSEIVAPMMCGGVTVYSPLKQLGAGPGKRIGIVGIGGLGHFGLLFAKALGADPVAISHSASKKADSEKMGAVQFISVKDEPDFATKYSRNLDGIIVTANNHDMPLSGYVRLLKPGCKLMLVGVPEKPLPELEPTPLIFSNVFIGGSLIGGTKEIEEMLQVASKSNVRSWVQTRPMNDANQAVVDMEEGKARYRYVLVNEKHLK